MNKFLKINIFLLIAFALEFCAALLPSHASAFDIYSVQDTIPNGTFVRVVPDAKTKKFALQECSYEKPNECLAPINHREFSSDELEKAGIAINRQSLWSIKAFVHETKLGLKIGGGLCVGGTAVVSLVTLGAGFAPGAIMFCGLGSLVVFDALIDYSRSHGRSVAYGEELSDGLQPNTRKFTTLSTADNVRKLTEILPK